MAKAPLRDFDLRDDGGNPVPVLGTSSNGLVAAAAIAFLIELDKGPVSADEYWSRICAVTRGVGDQAEIEAGELLLAADPDEVTAAMIRDLARNFVLVAVIPAEKRERRQIFKYSYHWNAKPKASRRSGNRVWAGLGFTSFRLALELNSLDSARSYHLECSAPNGVLCDSVTLPKSIDGTDPKDAVRTPVGHAYGSYGWDEAKDPADAIVRLVVDPRGLPPKVALSALALCLIFGALLAWPHAYKSLSGTVDAATALLLFVPALLIALAVRTAANDIINRLLLLYRAMAYGLSILLFFLGCLLVLHMPEAVIVTYWWTSLALSAFVGLITLAGVIRLTVSGRN
ncbi:hypothetical protein ACEXOS_005435 [Herbiconiux sp. P16]|uniref:hypothetical protein n=1 Tax=Herbiconiux wuyangfengii TaxID=3342794 RepID=UPI0035B7ECAC